MPHPALLAALAAALLVVIVLVLRARRRPPPSLPPRSEPEAERAGADRGEAPEAAEPAAEEAGKPGPSAGEGPRAETPGEAGAAATAPGKAEARERVEAEGRERRAREKAVEEEGRRKARERAAAEERERKAREQAEAEERERKGRERAEAEERERKAREQAEAEERERKEARRRQVGAVRKGLASTRGGLIARLSRVFQGKKEISPELLQSIEEVLITSDVGARTTDRLVQRLKERMTARELADEAAVWSFLREEARSILDLRFEPPAPDAGSPYVLLVLGVNGVGKTTTIGKLAAQYVESGKRVVLAAADTFRAAAVQQLEIWGRRTGCEVVKGKEGADPSSVAFTAVEQARAAGADVVIVDTAGRLHTKVPLMDELKKIVRVLGKAQAGAPHEVLLALDANTGQNAIQQAATFKGAVEVTGIALTKLDGTAKGGVILGICDEHRVPVRYIGVGEGIEDLRRFDADLFVAALFDDADDVGEAA